MSVYLDYNATCPIRAEVLSHVTENLSLPLNGSSVHQYGRKASSIIEKTRQELASVLGVSLRGEDAYRIIFTSGGTEANNLSINGVSKEYHLLTSSVEHPAVLEAVKQYEGRHTILPVSSNGQLDIGSLEKQAKQHQGNFIVSIILAHNETGIIQPIESIVSVVRAYNGLIHIDAVQALGKIPIDLSLLDIDMATVSAHKIGAMQGAGALIARKSIPLEPQMLGGGQEQKLRSGTENIPALLAFGKALEVIKNVSLPDESIRNLRDHLETELKAINPDVMIVGDEQERLGNTSCIITPNVTADIQLVTFDLAGIMISRGSACSSGTIKANGTLKAMGVRAEDAECAIRVSLGHQTTKQDIDMFLSVYTERIIEKKSL